MTGNLSFWLEKNAAFTPDKIAIRFEGIAISYESFSNRVHDHARALKHSHGVGRGDRVAFLGMNHPDLLYLFFACARLGAIFLPLNWRLAIPEHLFILKDATVKVLICDAELSSWEFWQGGATVGKYSHAHYITWRHDATEQVGKHS